MIMMTIIIRGLRGVEDMYCRGGEVNRKSMIMHYVGGRRLVGL